MIIGNQKNIYGINRAASENAYNISLLALTALLAEGTQPLQLGLVYINLIHLYTCVSVVLPLFACHTLNPL